VAKTVVLGKTPYRVRHRYTKSISLQPIDSEYPHTILLRRDVSDPRRKEWKDQWGHLRGGTTVAWYRQLDDDIFEKVP
jgi:hypothetical protein